MEGCAPKPIENDGNDDDESEEELIPINEISSKKKKKKDKVNFHNSLPQPHEIQILQGVRHWNVVFEMAPVTTLLDLQTFSDDFYITKGWYFDIPALPLQKS